MTTRLDRYLALADELAGENARALTEINAWLSRDGNTPRPLQDELIAGLANKIRSAFPALIEDCRAGRTEALHHLKTMAEAFICLHALLVGTDESKENSRKVLLHVYRERAKLLKHAPQHALYPEERDELAGWISPLKKEPRFTLASLVGPPDSSLDRWYRAVYRLACESAHLGDVLDDFAPDLSAESPDPTIPERPRRTDQKVLSAIHYGTAIVIGTLETISDSRELGFRCDVTRYWDNHEHIDRYEVPSAPTSPPSGPQTGTDSS